MGLNYPLHGYLHTFIAAVVVGVVFGLGMFFLERIMHPLYKTLLLEPEATFKKTNFIIAGVLGTMLHVLFDSPLYFDIKPFYPLTVNPFYGSVSSFEIYLLSFWLGVLGVVFYLLLLIFKSYKRLRKKHSDTPTTRKENTFKKDYLPSLSVSPQTSMAKRVSAQCQPRFSDKRQMY
jgi:hypothetical protein